VVADRQEGTYVEVLPEGGLAVANLLALSGDGRSVLFRSSTTNSPAQVHVRHLDTGDVTRIGLTTGGVTYASVAGRALSFDGNHVVFESDSALLVPGDTNGTSDVFVVTLDTQTTQRVSVAADGAQGDQPSSVRSGSITPDGRFVVFYGRSTTFPRAAENDRPFEAIDDVYLKDLQTGALTLVSTNARGVAADKTSVLPTISDDGRFVAFGSYASNLAHEMDPYDGPCLLDLCRQGFSFVKDLVTGRVSVVSVGLFDTLPDEGDQIEPQISADGRFVAFGSDASNLAVPDEYGTWDVFRARNPLWVP
jgi:hypothetical protein